MRASNFLTSESWVSSNQTRAVRAFKTGCRRHSDFLPAASSITPTCRKTPNKKERTEALTSGALRQAIAAQRPGAPLREPPKHLPLLRKCRSFQRAVIWFGKVEYESASVASLHAVSPTSSRPKPRLAFHRRDRGHSLSFGGESQLLRLSASRNGPSAAKIKQNGGRRIAAWPDGLATCRRTPEDHAEKFGMSPCVGPLRSSYRSCSTRLRMS